MPRTDDRLLKLAKSMRTEMTQPERELWTALRAHRFDGAKVTRQVVIGAYIVDFAARSRKLVIEVDGDTHADASRDERRDAWLRAQGYRVLRFTNGDVLSNLEGVLTAVEAALSDSPSPNPLPGSTRA